MTELVIGCPVFKRDWILPEWYKHAVTAASFAELEPVFVLVGDPVADRDTFEAYRAASQHETVISVTKEDPVSQGERRWNPTRYERMVELRNQLLGVVREMDPRFVLSLDSDILLHPQALASMLENLDQREWGAIGSRTYMDQSRMYPSYAQLTSNSGGLRRPDDHGCFTVDVIMAIKLMTRPAYHVDYEFNWHGEDIGWSINCRKHHVSLGWDGMFCSKHVMAREALHKVDERAGF